MSGDNVANSLDQDQAGQNLGPDLDLHCLSLKEFFEKDYFEEKKNSRRQKA